MFIGLSGTHGVGKTTMLYKLAHDYKIRYGDRSLRVISEVARDCPLQTFKGFERGSEEAQLWIFASQLREELEARRKFDIVLSDRTIYDVVAYTMEVNEDLAAEMLGLTHRLDYDLVYFLRPSNNAWVREDGGRSLDLGLREKVDENLGKIFGMVDLGVREVRVWRAN